MQNHSYEENKVISLSEIQNKKNENPPKYNDKNLENKSNKDILKITFRNNCLPKMGKLLKKEHLARVYNKDYTPCAQYKMISTWTKTSDSNKKILAYFVFIFE